MDHMIPWKPSTKKPPKGSQRSVTFRRALKKIHQRVNALSQELEMGKTSKKTYERRKKALTRWKIENNEMDWTEFRDTLEAYKREFVDLEINEDEYREKLQNIRRLNATEIEEEIEAAKKHIEDLAKLEEEKEKAVKAVAGLIVTSKAN